jgi:hypothetical protein
MTHFGGLGGIMGGRSVDNEDIFEVMLARVFGERIKTYDVFCTELWSALTNIDWKHTNGDTAGYSFRAAGDVIAAIRGEGCYMDWYCSGSDGVVSKEIATALAAEGWTYDYS